MSAHSNAQVASLVTRARAARDVEGVEHFAVDVELELSDRRVADPHRRCALVARQPGEFRIRRAAARRARPYMICRSSGAPATARKSHSCHAFASSRIAGPNQRVKRERRVAKPAIAIVPIARPAQLFGQRRRCRRDDAAGRLVGERLQRDRRPVHELVVAARVRGVRRPAPPPVRRHPQRPLRRRAAPAPAPATRGTRGRTAPAPAPTR